MNTLLSSQDKRAHDLSKRDDKSVEGREGSHFGLDRINPQPETITPLLNSILHSHPSPRWGINE